MSAHQPTKFRYTSALTPSRNRLSISSTQRTTPTTSNMEVCNGISSTTTTTTTPSIKIIKKHQNQTPIQNSRLQKQITSELPLAVVRTPSINEDLTNDQPRVSLDSIIIEYLTNQHALCKNPMSTCPQFNLFM